MDEEIKRPKGRRNTKADRVNENIKEFKFVVSRHYDQDIINYLNTHQPYSETLKKLIREAIQKETEE